MSVLQMDLFSVPDHVGDATEKVITVTLPKDKPMRIQWHDIDGWVKTRRDGKGVMPVPTLIQITGDACDYRPAKFRLADGVTVARWPSGDPALYFEGECLPLYAAVERRLAKEIK